MKKLLALVLALVMTLSLAVVGSNAAFKDADKVKDTYAEAVDVLSGMGVFNGYKNADGTYSFQPEGAITRAEVAAIVYRIYTADVKDKNISLYEGYGTFTDLAGANWAKGYIGYCANAGLVKGYDAKTFGPSDKVTGYQALAMILRAMGYDKNGEFTGANWQLYVAQTAQQLGILKNAGGESLQAPASRQLVAELLFQAIQKPCVTYTPAFGYVANSVVGKQDSLGVKNFGLTKTDADSSADKWGRPYYVWFDARDTTNGKYSATLSTVYATVKATPDVKYTTKVTECDIASDLSLKANTVVDVYDNGDNSVVDWTIRPLATTATKGAQGQQVEIYLLANGSYRAVVIDTYLAKVISNTNLTYDNAGHVRTYATINLGVYNSSVLTGSNKTTNAELSSKNLTLTSSSANFDYVAGDYVLVNVNKTSTKSDILGKAESVDGAQTVIYTNANKHTVNGTDYNDAVRFILDQAEKDGTKTYTWFFDQFGNVIGSKKISTVYTYGVITRLWMGGEYASTGYGEAMANVTYMDGTTETIKLNSIAVDGGAANSISYSTAYSADKSPMNIDLTNHILYLATDASTNYLYDSNTSEHATNYDIIAGDLKVVAAGDGHLFSFYKNEKTGLVDAAEVTDEINTAAITTNYGIINGKNSSAQNASVKVNLNTIFLVQTVDALGNATYTKVEGCDKIAAYTSATVDYVDVNNDGFAEYVYVKGIPANAHTVGLFYIGQKSFRQDVANGNASGVYYVKGYVDGVADQELKVLASDWNIVSAALSDEDTLYVVTYENGYAKGAVKVTSSAATLTSKNSNNYPYTVAEYAGYSVVKTSGGDTTNSYYFDGTQSYGVANATCVLPNTAFGDMTEKTVYLVYKTTDKSVVSAYIVDQTNFSVSVAADVNAVADSNIVKVGQTQVTRVADGTKAWFNITVKSGYKVDGYTVNGVVGTETVGTDSNGSYWVGEVVNGTNTQVVFNIVKDDTLALNTLTVKVGANNLPTPTVAYNSLEEAAKHTVKFPIVANNETTVTVTYTGSENYSAVVSSGAAQAPTAPSANNEISIANANVGSQTFITVAIASGANTFYVVYEAQA